MTINAQPDLTMNERDFSPALGACGMTPVGKERELCTQPSGPPGAFCLSVYLFENLSIVQNHNTLFDHDFGLRNAHK